MGGGRAGATAGPEGALTFGLVPLGLAFPCFANGVQELWSAPGDGGETGRLSLAGQTVSAWDLSPDGRLAMR